MSSLTRRTLAALIDLSLTGGSYIAYLFYYDKPSMGGVIIILGLIVLYFPVAEGITGQTLFKAVFGIKAITQAGRKPSIKASFIRHFFDGIDFLGIGLILAATRPDKKRIGDLVAETIVVRVGQESVIIPEMPVEATNEHVGFRPKRPALAGQRALAFLIDYTTYFVVLFILAKFVLPEGQPNHISSFFNLFIMIVLWFLIIVLPEAKLGYTLGKGAFDLKVAKLRESDSMLIVSLKRHLFDWVELSMYFGLVSIIMIINSKEHQRIGDMVARSIVVKDE